MSDTTLRIGAVVDALINEFPDISVSKVRFLEGEGLIHPERTSSGYRQFSVADVERVRYILRQQRDHFLPLKVIKDKLSGWERGGELTTEQPDGPPPETYFAPPNLSFTEEEMARTAGVSTDLIAQLIDHGVLNPPVTDSGEHRFNDEDVAIARAAHRLVRHGLEARHLRSIRLSANREVDLFRQLTGPMLRHANPANLQQAGEVLADVAQAARELQETMVRSDLRTLLGR
jgi:DNA-binding transcriptional MerR regulator